MPKVLISDDMSPLAAECLQNRGVEVDTKVQMTAKELRACIPAYDALAVRSNTQVTKDLINAAENLRIIGRAGIGVDNIDCEAATQKGADVMNTPFGNSITTAEHTIS